ncbi:MAG: hypothetical protein PHN64_06445 [Desulfovibrionaceae bacterium]|nr:hypothetical protein [Desulfovibrionaceae bacterium]
MYTCIHRAFAALFIPMACWQVWIFPAMPNYYLQHILIYPCIMFLGYAFVCGQWSWQKALLRWRWLCPWLAALLCAQAAAFWFNAPLLPQHSFVSMLLTGLVKLLLQLPFALLFVELLRLLLLDEQGRRNFMRGALAAFFALCCWCAVQALTIFTQDATQPALIALHSALASLLRTLSPWLEARWLATAIPMYREHAYALTEGRINGFFEEASVLATWLGLFFLPLGLAGCAAAQQQVKQAVKTYAPLSRNASIFLLMASLLLLLLCRSTAGVALCAVGIILALFLLLPRFSTALRYGFFASFISIVLLSACLTSLGHKASWQLLAGKSNRFEVTQISAEITLKYPFLGVGRGMFSPAYAEHSPLTSRDMGEMRTWKEQKSIPKLCAWLALSAEYGIPVALCLIGACLALWWRLRWAYRRQPCPCTLFWYTGGTAYFCLLAVAMLAVVEMRNPFAHTLLIALYCSLSHEDNSI